MKTIEEKAKAYDEAYKVAVELHNLCKEGTQTAFHRANLETMFPELAESEDERIMKSIFKALSKKDARDVLISQGIKVSDALAWLERQSERKTPRWMIDFLDNYRRKIGCSLDHDESRDVEGKILCIMQWLENQGEKDILEDAILDGYILDGNEDGLIAETIRYKHENQGRQNHTQEIEPFEAEHGKYYYCIKDYFCGGRKQASKGDVIQALRGLPIMGLKDASEYFLPVNFIKCNSTWGEEDEHRIKDTIYFLDTAKKHYASTEELDACIVWLQSLQDRVQTQPKQKWNEEDEIDKELLNAAILFAMNSTDEFACNGVSKEDVIDWLKSFKDRVQSQQKQEWSEEDSYYRNHIIQIIEEINNAPLKRGEDWESYINWLKSLRLQNHWKPSDRQMDSITCAVKKMKESACYDSELVSLLNDLKKLKEE